MSGEVFTQQAADVAANVGGETLVADTAAQLVAADASRERLIVSATVADVWLAYGKAAVVGQGICVPAGGQPYEERAWKGTVSAISAGAAVVGFTETVYATGDDQGEEPGWDEFTPSGPSDEPIPPPATVPGNAQTAQLPADPDTQG